MLEQLSLPYTRHVSPVHQTEQQVHRRSAHTRGLSVSTRIMLQSGSHRIVSVGDLSLLTWEHNLFIDMCVVHETCTLCNQHTLWTIAWMRVSHQMREKVEPRNVTFSVGSNFTWSLGLKQTYMSVDISVTTSVVSYS